MTENKNISRSIRVKGDLAELLKLRNFVETEALSYGFNEEQTYKICLAVDEACANLIRHSYRNDPNKEIDIRIALFSDKFSIQILDEGVSFNPLEYQSPDMKEYFKQCKPGGLGIHIIKSVMDEISYAANANQKNILTLVKYKN
jgi:anti-sigma regulatory factor (Ser/Thr protein kinase)